LPQESVVSLSFTPGFSPVIKHRENHKNRFNGIYIVDTPKRNPKGCKESSRWSESAETTGKAILIGVAPRRGARSLDVKIFYLDL